MFASRTLAAASLAVLAPLSAQAGLITNGSFEAQTLVNGTWTILPALTGWQADAAGVELRRNVVGAAEDGLNFVELDTTVNSAISQLIATTTGLSYELSGWYSPRAGVAADSNAIEVWWGNTRLATLNGSGMPNSGNVWQQFHYTVTGSGSDTLRFVAAGRSDGVGGSLDNIALTRVPEPASLALVLGALGALGVPALSRRRR
jgi:hypothetical protein